MDDDDLAKSLDANLWSAARVAQRAVPHLIARGGGSITMIASIWGREAGGAPGYNVAKAAVIALAKALARDYAQHGDPRQLDRARLDPVPRRRLGPPAQRRSRRASPRSSSARSRSAGSARPRRSPTSSRSSRRRARAGSPAPASRSTAARPAASSRLAARTLGVQAGRPYCVRPPSLIRLRSRLATACAVERRRQLPRGEKSEAAKLESGWANPVGHEDILSDQPTISLALTSSEPSTPGDRIEVTLGETVGRYQVRRAARPGRHGPGLPRARRRARPLGRAQDRRARPRRGSTLLDRAVPRRGARDRAAQPPARRPALRLRRVPGRALPRARVRRGRHAARARARTARSAIDEVLRHARAIADGLRARPRARASTTAISSRAT